MSTDEAPMTQMKAGVRLNRQQRREMLRRADSEIRDKYQHMTIGERVFKLEQAVGGLASDMPKIVDAYNGLVEMLKSKGILEDRTAGGIVIPSGVDLKRVAGSEKPGSERGA